MPKNIFLKNALAYFPVASVTDKKVNDIDARYRSIPTKIDHERILPLYDSDAQVSMLQNFF
jgi:hypothetical protein